MQNAKLPIIMRGNQRAEFFRIALPDWHDAGNNLKMDIMFGSQPVKPRAAIDHADGWQDQFAHHDNKADHSRHRPASSAITISRCGVTRSINGDGKAE